MRIIFLDYDGVITTIQYKYNFDERCINHLNDIIKTTGAKIVVSSSWRQGMSLKYLQQQLTDVGCIGTVISKTRERISYWLRGLEIQDWLEDNKVDNYVVLDDSASEILPFIDNSKIVATCRYMGLTTTTKDKAIKILKGV